jgi:hypothetical protein
MFAQGVTGLATCSQGYLSYKLTGPVLLAQGITGLAALSHSQGYLSCKLTAWSCLLKELLVLQLAHRVTYLANSQDRSCLLKGLLVLQLSAAHRVTCLANSRPWSCCSRNYWSCSSQLAHRVTYLANSRLDSLFGPIAKSTETCSQQRNLLCISNIHNWCLRGLLFCRLLVVMLYIDSLVTRPFHSSGFLARSSSLIC